MNFKEFKNSLSNFSVHQILFVGLGNRINKDDISGLNFFYKLRTDPYFCMSQFIDAGTTPENYLQQIINLKPSLIVFIDTFKQKRDYAEISWIRNTLIDESDFSTHSYSIRLLEKYILMYIESEIRFLGIASSYSKASGKTALGHIENFFNCEN